MKTPKLPASLVGVAGALATVLTVLEGAIPEPWHAIAVAVLAILSALGVRVVHSSVTLHGQAQHTEGFVAGQMNAVTRGDGTTGINGSDRES